MTKLQKIFLAVTILLIFAVLYFFFKPVLLAPSDYFFGTGGDGTKNYFTDRKSVG